jgi:hypothetical protein
VLAKCGWIREGMGRKFSRIRSGSNSFPGAIH